MRGVDLTIFDFDYDLTWATFFMNSGGHVYGRYGGRDEGPADQGLSIAGLAYAMGRALDTFRRYPDAKPQRVTKRQKRVEQFSAARRVKQGPTSTVTKSTIFGTNCYWTRTGGRKTTSGSILRQRASELNFSDSRETGSNRLHRAVRLLGLACDRVTRSACSTVCPSLLLRTCSMRCIAVRNRATYRWSGRATAAE